MKKFIVFLLFTCATCFFNVSVAQESKYEEDQSLNLNLNNSEDNLTAFIKARASLVEGEEVIFYAKGDIYGFVNGDRDKALMSFEMYNIARANKDENGGYVLLSREVGVYKDIRSGKILESFVNPYTQEKVEVVHVWNDPVNQKFTLKSEYGEWSMNHTSLGKDRICMNADIFLTYPSPLPVASYPKNSQDDMYEAAELFQFYFSRTDMNNPNLNSIPVEISWTRIGPWLPWMNMGQRPGNMVYHCTGYKLMGDDYDELPAAFIDYIKSTKPEFTNAPEVYSKPNETSWTYFKKINPIGEMNDEPNPGEAEKMKIEQRRQKTNLEKMDRKKIMQGAEIKRRDAMKEEDNDE